MTTVEVGDLPAALARLAAAATAVGWSVTATAADGVLEGVRRKVDGEFRLIDEPIKTIVLRFRHGTYAAWGCWRVDGRVAFDVGCCRHVPPGPFRTLAAFKSYLGIS